jgi:hypothetical protein
MGGCVSPAAGKDQYQTPLTPSLALRMPRSNLARRRVAMRRPSRSAAFSTVPWVWLPFCKYSRSHSPANLRWGRPAPVGRSASISSRVSLLRPVQRKFPASSILYESGGARGPRFDLICNKAGCDGASGEVPARNSVRKAVENSREPWPRREGLPAPRLLRWRSEKNAAVAPLSQAREFL